MADIAFGDGFQYRKYDGQIFRRPSPSEHFPIALKSWKALDADEQRIVPDEVIQQLSQSNTRQNLHFD